MTTISTGLVSPESVTHADPAAIPAAHVSNKVAVDPLGVEDPTLPPYHDLPPRERARTAWSNLAWNRFIPIAVLHVGCLAAPFFFSWQGLGVAAALWWVCGGLGICLCYHRLLTHRSFRTPKWFEYALTVLATTNWQGGPIEWVGTHRVHHRHSDHDHDPHSPKHGFDWGHILWCVCKHADDDRFRGAAKDLQRDPFMVFIDKYHWVAQFGLAAILLVLGGLLGNLWGGNGVAGEPWAWSWRGAAIWVIWGICVRMVFTYHATWFVNSAAHTWGYRSHQTKDDSRNLWWVALLSFGEGWHNNHHACDRAAAHGRQWWEIDLTYLTIRLLGLVGLASEIVPATESKRAPRVNG